MEQETLTELILQELLRALTISVDQLAQVFTPGLALLPFWQIIGLIGYGFFDAGETLLKQLRGIPVRVGARLLAQYAARTTVSTKVVRLDQAQQFAIDALLGAMYDLSGNVAPPGVHAAMAATKWKGLRKQFLKLAEKIALPKAVYSILQVLRYPAQFTFNAAVLIWNLLLDFMSIGLLLAIWQVSTADWERIALSQKHPRKRLYDRVINKRL